MTMTSMCITDGKGVQFTFDNGITISIQIGGGNYCNNYNFPIGEITRDRPLPPSGTAEIAVWDETDAWFDLDGDQVAGYIAVSRVLDFVAYLRSLPSGTKAAETKLDTSALAKAGA